MIEIELRIRLAYPDQVFLPEWTLFILQHFHCTNWIQCSVGSLLSLWPLCHSILVLRVLFFARSLPSAICDLPFAWLAKAIRKLQFPLHGHMWQKGLGNVGVVKGGGVLSCLVVTVPKKKKKKSPNSIDATRIKSKANQCQLPPSFRDFSMQI